MYAPPARRASLTRVIRALPLLVAAVAALVLAGCSGDDGESAASDSSDRATTTTTSAPGTSDIGVVFPGDEWETITPEEAGFDPAALEALAAEAATGGSACLAVVKDGRLVMDESWPGPTTQPREVFSATKSLTSTLVGIAEGKGLLDVTDLASEYVPEWKGTPSESVTVEHLLSNTSGRHWDAATDYIGMAVRAPDKTEFAIGLGQDAPPGTTWQYNNSAIQVLSAVLGAASGTDASSFAKTVLFDRIGMEDSELRKDGPGNPLTFMGLASTCTDMARWGHLVLNDGNWDGEQIVPADYLEKATGRPSSDLNSAYGWLWWLNRPGRFATPRTALSGGGELDYAEGQLVPEAPEDVFWALGFRNQIMAIIPSEGIVAVRLGEDPPPDNPFSVRELTVGVLDALTDR